MRRLRVAIPSSFMSPGTATGAQPQPCVEAPAHVPSIRLSAQERLCFLGGVWLKDDNKASEVR